MKNNIRKLIPILLITAVTATFVYGKAETCDEDHKGPELNNFLDMMEKAFKRGEKEIEKQEEAARKKSAKGVPLVYYREIGEYSGKRHFLLHSHKWNTREEEKSLISLPLLSAWEWETDGPGWGFFFLPALSGGMHKNTVDDGSTISGIYSLPLLSVWSTENKPEGGSLRGGLSIPLFTFYLAEHSKDRRERLRVLVCLPLMTGYASASDADGSIAAWGCAYLLSRYSSATISKEDIGYTDLNLIEIFDVPLVASHYSGLKDMNTQENLEDFLTSGALAENMGQTLVGITERTDLVTIKRTTLLGRVFKSERNDDGEGTFEMNPLFSYNCTSDESSFTISPLMMRITSKDDETDCSFDPWKLWPLAYRTEDKSMTEMLWPIFQKKKTPTQSSVKLRPIFSFEKRQLPATHKFNMLFGLLFHDSKTLNRDLVQDDAEGTRPESRIRHDTSAVWGFLFKRRNSDTKKRLTIGTSLLYKQTSDLTKDQHEKRLTPLIKYTKDKGKRSLRLLWLIKIPLGGGEDE